MISQYLGHLKQLKDADKFGRLAIELTIIITIKVALLWLLWLFFFSHPIAKDERQLAVTRMILNHSN
jgi:hypothetical protein